MKADVAKQDGERDAPAAAGQLERPRSDGLPVAGGETAADEDEDVFKEIPTVANRALPVPEAAPGESSPSPHETAGSYRLVRPTVSDFVAQPVATKMDPPATNRVVIGSARKPR
jgi:hypothetical protein